MAPPRPASGRARARLGPVQISSASSAPTWRSAPGSLPRPRCGRVRAGGAEAASKPGPSSATVMSIAPSTARRASATRAPDACLPALASNSAYRAQQLHVPPLHGGSAAQRGGIDIDMDALAALLPRGLTIARIAPGTRKGASGAVGVAASEQAGNHVARGAQRVLDKLAAVAQRRVARVVARARGGARLGGRVDLDQREREALRKVVVQCLGQGRAGGGSSAAWLARW